MTGQGWRITYSPADDGYIVRIGGKLVVDADGRPSIYYSPRELASCDEWTRQLGRSIERMSGTPCALLAKETA